MNNTRWLTAMLLLALMGACGGDKDNEVQPAPNNAPNNDPNNNEPPDFNFIPLNEDVCLPTADNVAVAHQTLDSLIERHGEFYVVEDMQLCDDAPLEGCSACGDNPMGRLLDAFEGLQQQLGLSIPADTYRSYFREALRFPARHLLLSRGGGSIALTQAEQLACLDDEGNACAQYGIMIESLAEDCQSVKLETFAQSGNPDQSVRSQETFGFQVPLMKRLPDPDEFESLGEVLDFVQRNPNWPVRAQFPEVTIEDGDCMTLTGFVPLDEIEEQIGSLAADLMLAMFGDEELTGHVKIVIQGRLHNAEVSNASPQLPQSALLEVGQ